MSEDEKRDEGFREKIEEKIEELEKEEQRLGTKADKFGKHEEKFRKAGEAASFIPEAGAVANEAFEEKAEQEERKRREAERKAAQNREEAARLRQQLKDLERQKGQSEGDKEQLQGQIDDLKKEIRRRDEASSSEMERINGLRNQLRDGEDDSVGKHSYKFVFWLTLVAYVVDALSGFQPNAGVSTARILFYLSLAFVLMVKYKRNDVWILSAIAIFLPYLINFGDVWLPAAITGVLFPIVWLLPVYPLWALYERNSVFFVGWLGIVGFLTFILILWNGLLANILPDMVGYVDVWGVMSDFFNTIWTATSDLWTAFWTGIGLIPKGIERSINYATGEYYTSIVDDQQGDPVGLYIDDVRASSDIYFPGDTAYLWMDIRGKTFKETINVETACFAKPRRCEEAETIQGTTSPPSFEVFVEQAESVQCKVESLDACDYSVEFTAGFDFETWGYVTYTFVDRQTRLNYLAQDKDINRDLDIDRALKPVYTPGPVRLGMSSEIPQPVGIDSEADPGQGLNTPFGVTLEDLWTDGEISRVREFDVLIPNQFELADCDAEKEKLPSDPLCEEDPDRCASEMTAYRFENVNAPKTFKTVNCRLTLAEDVDSEDVIGFGEKTATKTFVIKARYDYVLSEKKSVEVEE